MKIPVTIFTGFLGAGKTTIIQATLKQCLDRKFAVIVNEFGSVSIDGPIITQSDETGHIEVTNVTGGLIAYSSDDEFDKVVAELGARGSELDHLIIETSGLAVPTAIVERLAMCSDRFALDAIVAIIDTPQLLAKSDNPEVAVSGVFINQLDAADIVVLNKIEGIATNTLLRAEESLRTLSPRLRFVELAHNGRLDQNLLLDVHLYATKHMQALGFTTMPMRDSIDKDHEHDGWAPHDHGLHTHQHIHEHDPGWLSFALQSHQPQSIPLLVNAIETLTKNQPLFRVKGFVRTADNNEHELQCVRDRVQLTARAVEPHGARPAHHNSAEHEHHHSHEHGHQYFHETSEIVFIGYNIVRNDVVSVLNNITKTQWQ
jgi:cobalamin biosynthesis protein CobW